MHPKCPHCKDWIDLSKPHAVWNGKVYHCPCVIEVIAATHSESRPSSRADLTTRKAGER